MFKLDKEQIKKLESWRKEHLRQCRYYKNEGGFEEIYAGAIGGNETFKFTPTGLGDIIVVQCLCGEEINLTDYESW